MQLAHEPSQFRKRLAVFGPAVIALALGAAVLVGLVRERGNRVRVARAHETIEALDRTLASLVDAETSVRGYVITADTAYLEPYLRAKSDLPVHLARLRALAADGPWLGPRIDTLERLSAAKLALLDSGIQTRRTKGLAQMAVPPVSPRGKATMDSARAVAAGIQREEESSLAANAAAEDSGSRFVIGLVAAGSLVAALLGLLANSLLGRLAADARSLAQLNAIARAEAEDANRAKSDFLATMSHEIRTPINAILGYTQLIEMGLSGPVTPEQREQIERVSAGAHHLLGLVNDVLDLAKVESGTLKVDREPAIAGDTVDAALVLVRPQARSRGVKLSDACEGERTSMYLGDPNRVRQILTNLVANAVKFTAPGGNVVVRCAVADAPPNVAHSASGFLAFYVTDTGVGIPPEQFEKIFEPFTQGSSGYTRPKSGTGLGLTISRRLARLMGGDVVVESTLGKGSTFTVWLPKAARAPQLESAAGSASVNVAPRPG